MGAAAPEPLAALVHARNWLISAEGLIAEASAFIRGVTGANPGSDSEDICKRLDAWLTPMAEQPSRSEEHTSELQSLMRISYAVFCLKKKNKQKKCHKDK